MATGFKRTMNIEISGGFFTLFIVFLVLKLCNVITWSWWFVTMPLWIGFVVMLGLLLVVGFVVLVLNLLGK